MIPSTILQMPHGSLYTNITLERRCRDESFAGEKKASVIHPHTLTTRTCLASTAACGGTKHRYKLITILESGQPQHFHCMSHPRKKLLARICEMRFSPAFVVVDVAMVRVVRPVRYPPAVVRYQDERVRQVPWPRYRVHGTSHRTASGQGAKM